MISLLRAPFVLGSSHCTLTVPLIHGFTRIAVDNTRSERIAKAEDGLAEMQTVLDHAKRAVEAAD
jgi:hypothetical protein